MLRSISALPPMKCPDALQKRRGKVTERNQTHQAEQGTRHNNGQPLDRQQHENHARPRANRAQDRQFASALAQASQHNGHQTAEAHRNHQCGNNQQRLLDNA